ncbi:hypothetical protein [Mixta theicola]|uniref:hypothetical protein n=1 Tax=Mixta theicola TaxID=1458355 RepID=UPI0010574228|nr:hypothetical protein [Mixta theicola]
MFFFIRSFISFLMISIISLRIHQGAENITQQHNAVAQNRAGDLPGGLVNFMAVVEGGSFSRAAGTAPIKKPTGSQPIGSFMLC